MKVANVSFVAVPVTEMDRSRKFYEGIIGLTKSRDFMDGKWVEYDLGSTTLALVPASDDWKPAANGIGVALEMENLDEAVAELKKAGVEFFWEVFESPVCRMALVLDPDGNRIGIHKLKDA
ncbi:MAG: VOC family protein [Chthoniobacterales bacterium]|nr:VOC family protein [Chthoniobacterales bacterium]